MKDFAGGVYGTVWKGMGMCMARYGKAWVCVRHGRRGAVWYTSIWRKRMLAECCFLGRLFVRDDFFGQFDEVI